jgi:hypothetical protein
MGCFCLLLEVNYPPYLGFDGELAPGTSVGEVSQKMLLMSSEKQNTEMRFYGNSIGGQLVCQWLKIPQNLADWVPPCIYCEGFLYPKYHEYFNNLCRHRQKDLTEEEFLNSEGIPPTECELLGRVEQRRWWRLSYSGDEVKYVWEAEDGPIIFPFSNKKDANEFIKGYPLIKIWGVLKKTQTEAQTA